MASLEAVLHCKGEQQTGVLKKVTSPVQPLARVGRDASHILGRWSAEVYRGHVGDGLPLRFQLHGGNKNELTGYDQVSTVWGWKIFWLAVSEHAHPRSCVAEGSGHTFILCCFECFGLAIHTWR